MTTATCIAIEAKSHWYDPVLRIRYIVQHGARGQDIPVRCYHGKRIWDDAIHHSLFGTELQPYEVTR
jgi:hypothetical protein